MWPLLLLACAPGERTRPDAPDPVERACLDLDLVPEDGVVSFTSGGTRRRLVVAAPELVSEPLPLLVFWHGRSQRAEDMVEAGALGRLAAEVPMIAVAPDSIDRREETWEIGEGSRDVALFDDLVDCLVAEDLADPERVHVAGFSFGGLLTTWLAMHRADRLASAIPFSGGLDDDELPYVTPDWPLPVMVVWGGEGDVPQNEDISFEALSLLFSERLQQDGSVVIECDHGAGHRIPGAAPELLRRFTVPHVRGAPSPFADGAELLPAFCRPGASGG